MTIDLKSDLHLDFWIPGNKNPQKQQKHVEVFVQKMLPDNPGQTLILAGDLSHYNSQVALLLKECKKFYKNVVIVYGNHDMYLINPTIQQKYQWRAINRTQELKNICSNLGVHLLDGHIIEIDGVRIGGLCGWYDVSAEENFTLWSKEANDSKLISPKYKHSFIHRYQRIDDKLPMWDTNSFYQEQLQKLKNVSNAGCDVLVTHVPQMITPRAYREEEFRDDPNSVFYYVDNMDILKASGAKVYIHGHVHNTLDYHLSGLNIVCSPYGYPHDTNTVSKATQIHI